MKTLKIVVKGFFLVGILTFPNVLISATQNEDDWSQNNLEFSSYGVTQKRGARGPHMPRMRFNDIGAVAEKEIKGFLKIKEKGYLNIVNPNGSIIIRGNAKENSVKILVKVKDTTIEAAQKRLSTVQSKINEKEGSTSIEVPYADRLEADIEVSLKFSAIDLNIKQNNGKIEINDTSGDLKLNLTNGNTIIKDSKIEDGTIDQNNGSIRVIFNDSYSGKLRAKLNNGSINVFLPKSSNCNVYLKSAHGQAKTDIE